MIGANTSTQSEDQLRMPVRGLDAPPLGALLFRRAPPRGSLQRPPARTRVGLRGLPGCDAPPATITNAAATSRAVNPYNRGAG